MDVGETIEPAKEARVKTLSEQLVSDPNSQVFASLADMYREEGMLEEAQAMCQAGLMLHPRHVPGRLVLAKIHRDANQPLEARAALEKVLALDPENAEALALLASEALKPEESKPEELFTVVPLEGPAPPSSAGSSFVAPLGPSSELSIISEATSLGPATDTGLSGPEEGLKLVPWAEASVSEELRPPPPGSEVEVVLPEIERTTTDLVPGDVAREGFVITRPIDMEFPEEKEEVAALSPDVIERPSAPLLPKEEGKPIKIVEVPTGVEILLHEELSAPSTQPEEKLATERFPLPVEGSVFAAPTEPFEAPSVEEGLETTQKEVPLAEFMKSLSETEFLKSTPAQAIPHAEQGPIEAEILSDEMRGEMEKALEDLFSLAEVEGAMIVNRDGLVLAERTRGGINPEEAAALAASIFETTLRSIERMHLGQLDRGIVETNSGRLYLTAMGDSMVVLLTRDDTKMGLVLMRMKKVMERVRRVLG